MSYLSGRNFRIVIVGDRGTSGGMMMLTRDPSGSRASTNGEDSSTRRPNGAMIRSMTKDTWSRSRKRSAER